MTTKTPLRVMAVALSFVLLFTALPFSGLISAVAETSLSETVYLSSNGNDENSGTQTSPVATLDKAYELVNDGGTISIVDTFTLASNFSWGTHGKTVTVSGGTLNGAAVSGGLVLGEPIIFDNITLTMGTVYANGHKLTIGENVTTTSNITLYGGGKSGTTVESTDVTVLSGGFVTIYGGSNGGTVKGDTNLYIGGTVNKGVVTALAHANTTNFYGGGKGGTVGGNTNIVFTDNALSSYVTGGGSNSDVVSGDTNIEISGNAATYGVYGGTKDGSTVNGNINILMNSGSVADMIGASGGTSYTGNVYIELRDGLIDRRLWGGCYNEDNGTSGWKTTYYVNGNIVVALWQDFEFIFDGSDSLSSSYGDLSFFAHSRGKGNQSAENTSVIFVDSTAYSSLNGKLKNHDTGFKYKIFMSLYGPSAAADNIYYCSYSASGQTITQSYTKVSGSIPSTNGTATLSVDESISTRYTGSAVEAAKITYSNWKAPRLDITYTNNIDAGTATATVSVGGVSATVDYEIYMDKTPTVEGATIKQSGTQAIQFSYALGDVDDANPVVEYGMLLTLSAHGIADEDFNLDNEENITLGKIRTAALKNVTGVKSGDTFTASIDQIPEKLYTYSYMTRVYVKYADDTIVYSDIEKRSVSGVAKSIAKWVLDNKSQISGLNETVNTIEALVNADGTLTQLGKANNGEATLAYLNDNSEIITQAINLLGK